MKEQILIVESGGSGKTVQTALHNIGYNNVIIIDAENVKKEQLQFAKGEPFILHNPYPRELKIIYEGKQFECKGKHEYRLTKPIKDEKANGTIVREFWSCQCGKVLGS